MDRGCGGRRPVRFFPRSPSTKCGFLANDQRPTTADRGPTTNDYNLQMMDEQAFRKRVDAALESLKKSLMEAEESADIEVEDQSGALHISFEDHSKFVISPNAPVRQIWISALATSFKLDWSDAEQDFVLSKTGERLKVLVARLINQQLGEELVTLA
jgi:iron donor protein CyaY